MPQLQYLPLAKWKALLNSSFHLQHSYHFRTARSLCLCEVLHVLSSHVIKRKPPKLVPGIVRSPKFRLIRLTLNAPSSDTYNQTRAFHDSASQQVLWKRPSDPLAVVHFFDPPRTHRSTQACECLGSRRQHSLVCFIHWLPCLPLLTWKSTYLMVADLCCAFVSVPCSRAFMWKICTADPSK